MSLDCLIWRGKEFHVRGAAYSNALLLKGYIPETHWIYSWGKMAKIHHAMHCSFCSSVIWLEVCPSNKNPKVIGRFYWDAVKQLGGVPRKMWSDDGTGNSTLEALHLFLRSTHDDGVGSGCFSIGRSTSNQRIEAYWLHLLKDSPGW